MSIKYKKNPATNPHVNPKFMSQPDLFTAFGDTPAFVPVDDLTDEQLMGIPLESYSEEEWEGLPESIQLGIWKNDPESETWKRLDFESTEQGRFSGVIDWEGLPEELQELVYEQDEDSKKRIESMAEALAGHTPTNDEDELMNYAESDIDEYMSDEERLWKDFGEALMEKLEEAYPEVEFDEDEVKQAAEDYGFNQSNFEYSMVSGGYGQISFGAPGFYMEKSNLDHFFPASGGEVGSAFQFVTPEKMPEDEIAKALELAQEKNEDFSDSYVDADDVTKLIHNKWGTIEREYDYESWSIEADPNWEEIINDISEHLNLEPGRVHYEEHPPEERILFRGRQIGQPDEFVETKKVTFPLGDTYYAVDLIPSELKHETKKGKNCVGREQNGYPAALRAGRIRLLSIRPESDENVWKRTYLMELVLDEPDTTSPLEEIIERGGITHVEQIKGYNNRIPGFDRGLYAQGTPEWVSPAEADELLTIVKEDLNVQHPDRGTDTVNYILPALRRGLIRNPAKRVKEVYSFNVPTKN